MNPGIEFWNLDVIDPVEPVLVLQGHSESTSSLKAHSVRINLLLSGSIDQSVILWDLEK